MTRQPGALPDGAMHGRPRRLLHDPLFAVAQQTPGRAAVVADGAVWSYADLADASGRLCTALQQRGVRRGDRVVIHLDNGWACAVAIFGVLRAGGVMVVVNPQTRADKLAFILDDCGAGTLITSAAFQRAAASTLAAVAGLRRLLTVGGEATPPVAAPVGEPFERVLEGACRPADPGTIATDLAALIYTSGSTGEPKGVMHTHQSMRFAAESICEYLGLRADDRILNLLPLSFDYGLYQLLMAVHSGATLLLERNFAYPALLLQRLAGEAPTVLPGVPTLFSVLRSMQAKGPLQFPSVRLLTNTAAALPADFIGPLQAMFPHAELFSMYGLTECKRVSYLPPERLGDKPRSVGRAIPGTEVMVLSDEGRPVAPGETGILHVRGPHVMLGYWNRPELTAHMLREGAWPGDRVLCTHDRFTVDDEGFLYFVGRSDDIIKSRGEKVSPAEVEAVLYGIDGVTAAAVVGVPDDLLGEAIVAYVAIAPGAPLDAAAIRKRCAARLEMNRVPQQVVVCDALPTTANGKIDKRRLARRERDGSEAAV